MPTVRMGIDRYDLALLRASSLGRSSLNLLKIILPVLMILGTSVYLWTESTRTVSTYVTDDAITKVEPGSLKARFVHDFLNNEIDGPYNGEPLRELCASKKDKIQPGLIIKCQSPMEGFGNIKNMALNCLRFGIEAGG
jgi:hypothetical protein